MRKLKVFVFLYIGNNGGNYIKQQTWVGLENLGSTSSISNNEVHLHGGHYSTTQKQVPGPDRPALIFTALFSHFRRYFKNENEILNNIWKTTEKAFIANLNNVKYKFKKH